MRRVHPGVTVLFLLAAVVFPTHRVANAQDHTAAAMMARIEGPQSPDRQGLDALTLREVMEKYRVPGVSIAVIKDFDIHWAKGYGTADVATGAAVDARTLFQAGSISKPVTAVGLLTAVQDGHVSLDAAVNTILKSWKAPPLVTPRSLLSHTSGADDSFGFPGYHPSQPRPSLVQILDGQAPSSGGPVLFTRPPFTAMKYSGGGYVILQLVLTDLLGKPFPDLMRERVFERLGMTDSAFEQPLSAARDGLAARAHDWQGRAKDAKWRVYPELAAAGLWTTPTDIARLAIEVQHALRGPRGRVLSQAMAREAITPAGIGPYGAGFGLARRGEGWYFSHGGINWGFHGSVRAHVRRGYGVVVMANSDSAAPVIDEIEARVTSAYGWDALDKPLPR